MYLQDQILQKATELRVKNLSSLLNIYDSFLKKHQISPTSSNALELYASLISKFISENTYKKPQMDPNLFSFGKKKYKEIDREDSMMREGKKLRFQNQKLMAQVKKRDDSYKYLVQKGSRRESKESNIFKYRQQQTCQSKQNSRLGENNCVKEVINDSQLEFQKMKQYDVEEKSLRKILQENKKKRWFSCLKERHDENTKDNILNLRKMTLLRVLSQRYSVEIIESLKNHLRQMEIKQERIEQTMDYYFKKRFFNEISSCMTQSKYINKQSQQTAHKLLRTQKILFMKRFIKNTITTQLTLQNNLQIQVKRFVDFNMKQKTLNILFSSPQQYESQRQQLEHKLIQSKLFNTFTALKQVLKRKQGKNKQRTQWIRNNGAKKLFCLTRIIEALISQIPNKRLKEQQGMRYIKWSQSSSIQQNFTKLKIQRTFYPLTDYLIQEQSNISAVNNLRKKISLQYLMNNVERKFQVQFKQKQYVQTKCSSNKSKFIQCLKQSQIFYQKRSKLDISHKRICFKKFVSKLIAYSIDKSYKNRLEHEVERYRYIKMLKSHFFNFVEGLIVQRKQRVLLTNLSDIGNKQILKSVFPLLQQQIGKQRIVQIKQNELIRIRKRKLKEKFYHLFKKQFNNVSKRETNILKKCFKQWKSRYIYSKHKQHFYKSLSNDRRLYQMNQIFQILKLNMQTRIKQKQIFNQIQQLYHQRLKTNSLKSLVRGTIKSYQILTFVTTLEMVLKKKVFANLNSHKDQDQQSFFELRKYK